LTAGELTGPLDRIETEVVDAPPRGHVVPLSVECLP